MRPALRLPIGAWFVTSALLIAFALRTESAVYGAAVYLVANGAALLLGVIRQPPLSDRAALALAWCTALQLPTMLMVVFDLEGNRNPRKQALRDARAAMALRPTVERPTSDRSQRPRPNRTDRSTP